MPDKDYDVFIAYPGAERNFATELRNELKLLGLKVFLDTDLPPGSPFMRDIPAALERTHVLAVVLVPATPATPAGWYDKSEVAFAIERARAGTIDLVPIRVDEAKPIYGLEQLTPIKCGRKDHSFVAIRLHHAVQVRKGAAPDERNSQGENLTPAPLAASSRQARCDAGFWVISDAMPKKDCKSPWSQAIRSMSLWPEEGHESLLRPISEEVADFAYAQAAPTEDPWFDENYPVRVLDCLGDLSNQIGHLALSEAEVAALVCAVFYREAAYGAALKWLEKSALSALAAGNAGTSGHPEAARLVAAASLSSPLLKRRWAQFHKSGMKDELRALQSWLTRKAVTRYTGQWQMADSGTLPAFPLTALQTQPHGRQFAGAQAIFTQKRMARLARCVRCDPERIFPANDDFQLEVAVLLEHDLPPLRERLLGTLLCLAGWLALDIRSIDDTFAEHVGASGGFPPARMCSFLNSCTWQRIGDTLELAGKCPHPLADRTVQVLVEQAYAALSALAALIARHGLGLKDDLRLPIRISADAVTPSGNPGDVPYVRPHLHFQLSTGEIRELLMGEKLYGDPDVAIREMYQNALDACRYAKARTEYVGRTLPVTWSGRITFRQGVDSKSKRRFIECEDTGIGMGERELTSCFAQAGRRFADLPEFLEEQELWRKLKDPIEFVPNSQFGIGVLSYFMISDEIEVTSCRMTDKGEPGPRFSVLIPGSGSLFQLQNLGRGERTGTKVRLYLRDDWQSDCEQVLLKWLVVAEFETEVINESADSRTVWQPGAPVLAAEDWQTKRWAVVPRQFTASGDSDFWWMKDVEGLVLADGIRVTAERPSKSRGDVNEPFQPWCSIINLRGQHRPALTVDRRKLLLPFARDSYDLILSRHAEAAAAIEGINFAWLWTLAGESKTAADRLVEHLSANGKRLPVEGDGSELSVNHYPVSTMGLHEWDDPVTIQWIREALSKLSSDSAYRRLQMVRGIEINPRDPLEFTLELVREMRGKDGAGPTERDFFRAFDIEPHFSPAFSGYAGQDRDRFRHEVWPSINRWLTSPREIHYYYDTRDNIGIEAILAAQEDYQNRRNRDAVILSGAPITLPKALCDPSLLYDKRSYQQMKSPFRYRDPYSMGIDLIPTSAAEAWAAKELTALQKRCKASIDAGKADAWTVIGHRAAVWIAAGHEAPQWLSDYLPPIKLAESQRAVAISKPKPISRRSWRLAAMKAWFRINRQAIRDFSIIGPIVAFAIIGLVGSIWAAWRWLTS